MEKTEQDTMKEIFGDVIYAYTRAQAIEDGVLIDVTAAAREAGIKHPTALTSAVWADYVAVPDEMKGHQDEMGRLWHPLDVLVRRPERPDHGRHRHIRGDLRKA